MKIKFCSYFSLFMFITRTNANNVTFKTLNDRSYDVYKQKDMKTYTCTNPTAGIFGGFGNLMFSILGAQVVGTLINRVVVMNHHLMLNMFDHPDIRQSWDLIPFADWPEMKKTVGSRPIRCSGVKDVPFEKYPAKYGTNGCFQAYLSHPQTAGVLLPLLPMKYPESNISFYDQMSAQLAEWTLSRPAKVWSSIVDEYKKATFSPCGANVDRADMAVQFRTWRDVAGEAATYHQVGGLCHEKCAAEMALHTFQRLKRPICIFITSDNETSSAQLAQNLSSLSPGNIHAVYGAAEKNTAHWHSVTIVDTARWGPFDVQELRRHQELKDWMLLGEASHATYTVGSTFAITARLRAGLHQQMHDKVPITTEDGNCTCSSVYPNYHIENQLRIRERTRRLIAERRRMRNR
jgi:hypothetical protein